MRLWWAAMRDLAFIGATYMVTNAVFAIVTGHLEYFIALVFVAGVGYSISQITRLVMERPSPSTPMSGE